MWLLMEAKNAKELNEYDIAQPDNLDINIDSIYIVCEDNEPLDDPWESIHKDPDIISFFSEQTMIMRSFYFSVCQILYNNVVEIRKKN